MIFSIIRICHCRRMNYRRGRINVRDIGTSTRDRIHQKVWHLIFSIAFVIHYKIKYDIFLKDFGIQNFLRRCQAHIDKIKPEIYSNLYRVTYRYDYTICIGYISQDNTYIINHYQLDNGVIENIDAVAFNLLIRHFNT